MLCGPGVKIVLQKIMTVQITAFWSYHRCNLHVLIYSAAKQHLSWPLEVINESSKKGEKIYQRMMLMIKALLDIKSFTYVIMNVLRKTFFPKNVSSYEYSIELQHRNTERKFKFQPIILWWLYFIIWCKDTYNRLALFTPSNSYLSITSLPC